MKIDHENINTDLFDYIEDEFIIFNINTFEIIYSNHAANHKMDKTLHFIPNSILEYITNIKEHCGTANSSERKFSFSAKKKGIKEKEFAASLTLNKDQALFLCKSETQNDSASENKDKFQNEVLQSETIISKSNNDEQSLLLKSIINTIDVGIFVSNDEGAMLFANDEFINIFDLSNISSITNILQSEVLLKKFKNPILAAKAIEGLSFDCNSIELELKTGICVEIKSVNIDNESKPVGNIITVKDITNIKAQTKHIEKTNASYEAMLNTALDAIITIDDKGIIQTANLAAEHIFGYEHDYLSGKNVNILMPTQYHHFHNSYISNYIQTGINKVIGKGKEITCKKKNGELFPAELSLSDFIIDNKIYFTGIVRDISERAKDEKILKESELKYKNIFDLSPNTIVLIDNNGYFLEVNKSIYDYLGYLPEEIIGLNISELPFLDAETKELAKLNFLKRIMGEELTPYTINMYHKNGELKYASIRGVIIKNNDGGITQEMLLVNDVTEQKLFEQKMLEKQKILDQSQYIAKLANWTYNVKSQTFQVSKNLFDIFEIKQISSEMQIDTFIPFIHIDDYHLIEKKIFAMIKDKIASKAEFRINVQNGKIKYLHSNIACTFTNENEIESFFGTIQDISERVHFEKILIESKDKAESASKSKSIFLANMSHEIRTPMNAILGFAELLKRRVKDQKAEEYLNGILIGAESLMLIINDILDLSKIESGKMIISPNLFSFKKMMHGIEQFFSAKVESRELQYEHDIPLDFPDTLFSDEVRFRQILINIVGNAVKFTDKGFVKIKVDLLKKNIDNSIDFSISVRDSGIGMKPKQIEQIYAAFTHADPNVINKQGGTGLGLTITKSLVEMLGGSIEVNSIYGAGSEFIIYYYSINTQQNIINSFDKEEQLPDFGRIKILIVEDADSNRMVLKKILEAMNVLVIEAVSGEQGYELAEKEQPELIFMDVQMPGIGGIEAAKRIKINSYTSKIPVIAMTAHVLADEVNAIEQVMDGYIPKPVSTAALSRIIYKFVYNSQKDKKKSNEKLYDNLKSELTSDEKKEFKEKYYLMLIDLAETNAIDDILVFCKEIEDYFKNETQEIGFLKLVRFLKYETELFNIDEIGKLIDKLIKELEDEN